MTNTATLNTSKKKKKKLRQTKIHLKNKTENYYCLNRRNIRNQQNKTNTNLNFQRGGGGGGREREKKKKNPKSHKCPLGFTLKKICHAKLKMMNRLSAYVNQSSIREHICVTAFFPL